MMDVIRPANLAAIDLNLLKVLAALIEERSVTGAGRRVGLSQPAASNALRRLREVLEDPLLVRGSDGFELTPHALALQEPVRCALAALAYAFRPPDGFEPESARLTVRVAASELAAVALLPRLLPILAREAPGMDLVVRSGDSARTLAWLQEGEVDVALGGIKETPANASMLPLMEDRLVLLVRAGHPLLEGEVTAERLIEHPAVLVSPAGDVWGIVDEALAALGLRRRVRVTVPNYLLAPRLVRDSDMTLVYPESLAAGAEHCSGLERRPLSIGLPPLTVRMLWLARTEGHAPLAWLRSAVARAAGVAAD